MYSILMELIFISIQRSHHSSNITIKENLPPPTRRRRKTTSAAAQAARVDQHHCHNSNNNCSRRTTSPQLCHGWIIQSYQHPKCIRIHLDSWKCLYHPHWPNKSHMARCFRAIMTSEWTNSNSSDIMAWIWLQQPSQQRISWVKTPYKIVHRRAVALVLGKSMSHRFRLWKRNSISIRSVWDNWRARPVLIRSSMLHPSAHLAQESNSTRRIISPAHHHRNCPRHH